NNCQRPVWSPQGRSILFGAFNDADWHLALINADGSGFRYLKRTDTKGSSLWSFCWTPDGRSIYAQDLSKLYLFDTTGNEIKSWNLDALVPAGSFNSGSTFSV